jgi:hypothetical protein
LISEAKYEVLQGLAQLPTCLTSVRSLAVCSR